MHYGMMFLVAFQTLLFIVILPHIAMRYSISAYCFVILCLPWIESFPKPPQANIPCFLLQYARTTIFGCFFAPVEVT